MRFDIVSIFPDYFNSLDLSLVGKAKERGLLEVEVHNLRDWAHGKHLAVDDTPAGGGAGMVMRADVWGRALDDLLRDDAVLAIPTPSGAPLTQRDLEQLAHRDQVVVACGRYEGIDARVAQHYGKRGVTVFPFSLGDYVLNGGEVAALALVEGVGRLVDGVVGNAESLVEESFSGDGLLEYPVYTQPRAWEGEEIPKVLLSGDHARIQRWRRDQSLKRTAQMRPQLLEQLLEGGLTVDGRDREVLARQGWNLKDLGHPFVFEEAPADLSEVSALAGQTFPLACPPGTRPEEIRQFVAANLSPEALDAMREDGARILVARLGAAGEAVGYSLVEAHPPADLEPLAQGSCYVSKVYVRQDYHGTGLAGALLETALLDATAAWGSPSALLGTNQANKRAIRFYRKHDFVKVGKRTFDVGGRAHRDFVFVRDLTQFPPR